MIEMLSESRTTVCCFYLFYYGKGKRLFPDPKTVRAFSWTEDGCFFKLDKMLGECSVK